MKPRIGRVASNLLRLVWVLPLTLWLIGASITWRYAIDVPYWDSWEHTELVTGTVPFNLSTLWAQENEHRVVVQKLFEVVWAKLTGWDHRLAAFVPLLLVLVVLALYAPNSVRDRPGLTPAQRGLLIALLSLWFVNVRQTDVLVWGILFSWVVLVVVFVLFDRIWRAYVAGTHQGWAIPLLVAVAVTCTGQGLALCAFLVLAGVLSCLAKDLPTSRILPMSALGALGMGVYYVGYYQSAQWPSPLLGLEKPVAD